MIYQSKESRVLINYVQEVLVSVTAWQGAFEVDADSFQRLSGLDEWDPFRFVVLRFKFGANWTLICNTFDLIQGIG